MITDSINDINELTPNNLRAYRKQRLNLYRQVFDVDMADIRFSYHIYDSNGEEYWAEREDEALKSLKTLAKRMTCQEVKVILKIEKMACKDELINSADIHILTYNRSEEDTQILRERKFIISDHHESRIFKIVSTDGHCEINQYLFDMTREQATKSSIELVGNEEHILTEMNIFEYLADYYEISLEKAQEIVDIVLANSPKGGGQRAA